MLHLTMSGFLAATCATALASPGLALDASHTPGAAAPVVIQLGHGGLYQAGDTVAVRISAGTDGYLLVLRADAEGRVRVLFPLDPDDDAYVRGGRRYDILSRGDRPFSFIADLTGGQGTILAAISPDPIRPGLYALNGHWDYNVFTRPDGADDEFALRRIAEQVTPGRFEYDLLPYTVEGGTGAMTADTGPAWSDGGASSTGVTNIAIGLGSCWNCFGGWWGAGWGMGWGMGWGWGWAPIWVVGPGWGGGWSGGGNPGWNPGGPGRFPGFEAGAEVPYRPRAGASGTRGDGLGVRGSLGSSGLGYRGRSTPGELGVRGEFTPTTRGTRGGGTRVTTGQGSRGAGYGTRGSRVAVPGRQAIGTGGRGGALGGRSSGATRGSATGTRGGRGVAGGRGASGASRGFSGGGRGFGGGGFSGGARAGGGGGYRGR